MKKANQKITWITAYDYPFAMAAEKAGIDMILVGDSGGMVQLGYKTTNPVVMDEMITFAKAVHRGAPNTFIVGDMPQGSYEVSDEEAIRNALRFVKEAGCDAVKLEGGKRMASRIKAVANAGILAIGHLGLTPQSAASFGGYTVQGKTRESFEQMVSDADALVQAGICLLLLEAMPAESAEQIARRLAIPVLGIGAGNRVDGQLVIMHDLMGFYQEFRPWFAKCYLPDVIADFDAYIKSIACPLKTHGRKTRQDGMLYLAELSIKKYISEVVACQFPNDDYTYPLQATELAELTTTNYWSMAQR
jgi:3-methyl-2-oxobutanoate hydroxymethyltransferase